MNGRPALVLASASPRRADLLRMLGLCFTTHTADVDETPRPGEPPHEYVDRLARDKAATYTTGPALVIAADTVVLLDDQILGKPVDETEARTMLRRLSGRAHEVLTGLAVAHVGDGVERRTLDTVVSSHVWFTDLTDRAIDWYVATGEPLDKAGAYGIQSAGGLFVEAVNGSYHNVVGLPLAELDQLTTELGWPLLDWASDPVTD